MAMIKSISKEEQDKLRKQRMLHLNLQRLCRVKYYKHCKKAQKHPEKYASIIIDNMDQQKTNLPHFAIKSKVDQSLPTMKHHLTGVMNHGQGRSYMFTWGDQFSGDSNVMLNCLQHVLEDIAKNNNGVMPPVLYLQADNCPKDNKNRFIISFLASLIKQGIFEKIKLSFLMVGHTHEDIDQMFSCVSRKLHRNDAATVDEPQEVVRSSYTWEENTPAVSHIHSLVDYKSQLGVRKLEGIKTPHIFKLKMVDGQTILSFKDWPLKTEQYRHLSIDQMGVENFNLDRLVKANEAKICENKERMAIDKYKKAGILTNEQVEWWTCYLNTIQAKAETPITVILPKYAHPAPQRSNIPELEIISERMSKLSKSSTMKCK